MIMNVRLIRCVEKNKGMECRTIDAYLLGDFHSFLSIYVLQVIVDLATV